MNKKIITILLLSVLLIGVGVAYVGKRTATSLDVNQRTEDFLNTLSGKLEETDMICQNKFCSQNFKKADYGLGEIRIYQYKCVEFNEEGDCLREVLKDDKEIEAEILQEKIKVMEGIASVDSLRKANINTTIYDGGDLTYG